MTRLNNTGQSFSLVDASTGNFPKKVFLDENRTSLFDLRKEVFSLGLFFKAVLRLKER